ncbi:MAG: hypothetical protein AAGC74_08715 [Verrucomicrobiota bacterium]
MVPVSAVEFDEDGGVGEGGAGFDDEDGEGFGGVFEDDGEGAVLEFAELVAAEGFVELDAVGVDAWGAVVADVAEFAGAVEDGGDVLLGFEDVDDAGEDFGGFFVDEEGADAAAGVEGKGFVGDDDPVAVAEGADFGDEAGVEFAAVAGVAAAAKEEAEREDGKELDDGLQGREANPKLVEVN